MAKVKKAGNAVGAPRFVLSKKEIGQVVRMAGIMCTWQEIADVLDVSKHTLEHYEPAKKAFQKGKATGKSSMKKAQYDCAVKTQNPSMLIWMGKIHLGQKEHHQVIAKEGAANVCIGAFTGE